MRFIIVAIVLAFAVATMHPVNHEMVAQIKAEATSWTPMEVEENPFAFMPFEKIKGMMSTKLTVFEETAEDLGFEPKKHFDSREEWGEKIHGINNQEQCAAGWAFGAVEALSDRLAIQTKHDVVLSAQHLVSCDRSNMGCNGGYLDKAWMFMIKSGVMTEKCFPYVSGKTGRETECKYKCENGKDPKYYHARNFYTTGDRRRTQQHIEENGPVEGAMTVFEDFLSYKHGVYYHTGGRMLGGHAIKVVGWGEDEYRWPYWIMANSWGTAWGEEGFFKIRMGDCGCDAHMIFGEASDLVD